MTPHQTQIRAVLYRVANTLKRWMRAAGLEGGWDDLGSSGIYITVTPVAGKGAGLKVKVQPGTHVASLETRQEMKLLTHNMLTSHVKGVKNGYPFKILASQVVANSVDFNAEFIARMIPKLEWTVLKSAAESVGFGSGLPDSPPDAFESDEDFLKAAHHVLLEVEVVEGDLECPETGRKFPVSGGIPNMLLTEDEV